MIKQKNAIDFIVVSYYRIDYIRLIIKSINKFVSYPHTINIVFNELPDSEEVKTLQKICSKQENIKLIQGTSQQNNYANGEIDKSRNVIVTNNELVFTKDKYGNTDKIGPGSKNHSEGLTIGMKNTENNYVCFLDMDVVFLNKWVDEILPLLDDYFLVSHRFDTGKGPSGIVREMFMIFRRENFEKYNLYPNIDYVDAAGNITKFCIDNQFDFYILKNSLGNIKLKKEHLLNLSCGEQAYTPANIPFFYHYGRGATLTDELYDEWITNVENYLNDGVT
tara:strand:- start:11989 stop:12822 length:834 start_codon:yes stop_codon:yes gene_type:complete